MEDDNKLNIIQQINKRVRAKNLYDLEARTQKACILDNIEEIKQILISDSFPSLTKEEQEKYVFKSANLIFSLRNQGLEILKYLVFDYGIKEEYCVPAIEQYFTAEVKEMFKIRKLNAELNSDLEVNNNKSIQKVKI
jgi:hypothetical protein